MNQVSVESDFLLKKKTIFAHTYKKAKSSRMKLLISNAQVCDFQSPFHGKTCDILVNGDFIEQISLSSKKQQIAVKGIKQIEAKGLLIFPGLFDMRADFCDPGFEQKETLASGSKAALNGGYTDVALLPSTNPVRDSKIGVEYVLNQGKSQAINLHAYGALSQGRDGKELAEHFDMHSAGAIGFTDGNRPVDNSGLLLRSLLYNKIFNGLVLVLANDSHISEGGRMHEGNVSTLLGLKGIPTIAEELIVHRDIEILKYTGGRLHFSVITSKGSVELIRKAKKQGLLVTADVSFANLCFTDENLMDYDSNFKLHPPLRSKQDQKALWEGVQDGTIDAIVSNHQPQNKEHKEVEFEYALPGMITLQTLLPKLLAHKPATIELSKVVAALTEGPRRVLNQNQVSIAEGKLASLTLFDPSKEWIYKNNFSKSENSPLLNTKLTGAFTHVICKDQLHTL
ncbi:MAG: dihydroorotase [Bacteroidetes bacterium B1(2017)]|nr:MAG: dihydroorotase [Bacteroidetes bacterium B1(2017)]